VIHLHNAHHFHDGPARAAVSNANGSVLVNSVHDHVGEHVLPGVLQLAWDRVVYVSAHVRAALPSARPSVVLPLGIDLNRFHPQIPPSSAMAGLSRPIVFHPARLLPWKGAAVTIAAFASLHRDLGGTLVLCSEQDIVSEETEVVRCRRQLVDLCSELGVSSSVVFLSFLADDMAEAYSASDVVVYPTTGDEPFGLVPLEAMACGVPVVVSRSGGMTETVASGVTGLVVDKNNHPQLAAAMKTVLHNSETTRRMVSRGLLHVRVMHGLSEYVSNLVALYDRSFTGR